MGSGSIPALHASVVGYVRLRNIQANVPADERPDVGVLFGALSTLQATSQLVIGPLLFGLIYSATVHEFPRAIFVVAGAFSGLAFILMLFVRPRKRVILVGPRTDGRVSRGRSTQQKDIVIPAPSMEWGRYLEDRGTGVER